MCGRTALCRGSVAIVNIFIDQDWSSLTSSSCRSPYNPSLLIQASVRIPTQDARRAQQQLSSITSVALCAFELSGFAELSLPFVSIAYLVRRAAHV